MCVFVCLCVPGQPHLHTSHAVLKPVDQLVRLAAIQQGPDGWQGVQNHCLRMSINVVLGYEKTKQPQSNMFFVSTRYWKKSCY